MPQLDPISVLPHLSPLIGISMSKWRHFFYHETFFFTDDLRGFISYYDILLFLHDFARDNKYFYNTEECNLLCMNEV